VRHPTEMFSVGKEGYTMEQEMKWENDARSDTLKGAPKRCTYFSTK